MHLQTMLIRVYSVLILPWHRFVHGPEDGVDDQPAEGFVLEVVGVAQGGEENAGSAIAVGPGDRLGLFVGDGANQEPHCRFG